MKNLCSALITQTAQRPSHLQQGESADLNWRQSTVGLGLAGTLLLLTTVCEFSRTSSAAPPQNESKRETNVSSGNNTSTASPNHIIKIKALIDGADTIKIQGNKLWYEHESWELPGKWQGADEDTLINGKPWHPEWLGEASPSRSSDPYLALQPAFSPKTRANIKLTKIAGRGPVEISQLPTPKNHQTLSIHFDDAPLEYQGADWYEVAIQWNNDTVTNVIKIRALIDGADTVKIQGNKVWYEHESWDLPGKWQGRDEDTLINGMAWHPTWHIFIDHSKPYHELQPVFAPKSPADIKLNKLAGRGPVKITELPSAENHQTLAVRIDDGAFGADWYELSIEWR